MKSTYGRPQQKERKMNNLNNENMALKSVQLASLYLYQKRQKCPRLQYAEVTCFKHQ